MYSDTKRILLFIALASVFVFGGLAVYQHFQKQMVVAVVETVSHSAQTVSQNFKEASQQIAKEAAAQRPEWITVTGQSKEICIKASGGVLDKAYMRCRDGWQEQVVFRDGRKVVLQERPIRAGSRF